VAAFELAAYPVTSAQFACFVEAGGYDHPVPVDGGAGMAEEKDSLTEQDLRRFYRKIQPGCRKRSFHRRNK
jgi:formylglycine-generating enzyme required for sulfatase activity